MKNKNETYSYIVFICTAVAPRAPRRAEATAMITFIIVCQVLFIVILSFYG